MAQHARTCLYVWCVCVCKVWLCLLKQCFVLSFLGCSKNYFDSVHFSKGFKTSFQFAHERLSSSFAMVGIVTRVHIRQLLEVLLLTLGQDSRVEGANRLPDVLCLLAKTIPFLASIHEDNHLLSKLLAKSFSAIQELQRVVSNDPSSSIQDVKYQQHSKWDPHRVMSPLKVKLRLVDRDVKIEQAKSMTNLCGLLGKVATSRCSEGGDLLLVPVLCMMFDILPHLKDSIRTPARPCAEPAAPRTRE